jgi:hypothetical protein
MSNVCVSHLGVVSDGPLDPRARAVLVDILLEHDVLRDAASAYLLESVTPERLARIAVSGWMVVTPSSPGVRHLGAAAPGSWLSDVFAAQPSADVLITAKSVAWQGAPLAESGFAYVGLRSAVAVDVMNLDGPGEYRLGSFFDVLTIAGKGAPDKALASSALARKLTKKLRLELACGSSWF